MIYVAKDGERLDSIVYKHYKSLDDFAFVLEANMHLANKIYLSAGDKVLLPKIKRKAKEDKVALW